MKTIALTGADDATLDQANRQLLAAAATWNVQLTVLPHVQDAAQASSVYCGGGELWRRPARCTAAAASCGASATMTGKPELDALVDRWIDDSSPAQLVTSLDDAFAQFVTKTPGGSMKHKYVRHSEIGFILWPDGPWDLHHKHVANIACIRVPGDITSAGFAFITASGVTCLGRSESLNLNSAPGDTVALARQLGIPAAPPVFNQEEDHHGHHRV